MHAVGLAENTLEIAGLLEVRKRELGLSNLALDDISGCQSGYSGKIFCGIKRLGDMSMPAMLGALGCRLVVVADDQWLPQVTQQHLYSSHGGGAGSSWRNLPQLLPPPERVLVGVPVGAKFPDWPHADDRVEILPPIGP